MTKDEIKKAEGKMQKALGALGANFNTIRAGRANPAVLDRIMVLPDHPTPLAIRTHSSEPVPFMIYDSEMAGPGASVFSEKAAAETGLYLPQASQLMDLLIGKDE